MRNQRLMLRVVISSVNALRGVACWLAWRMQRLQQGWPGRRACFPSDAGLGTCC